jgi:hypothetical protein
MIVLWSMLLVSCVHEGGSNKRKGTCSRVIAYLLQLVQRALSDTTLLEIVLRRIHHLLDSSALATAILHTLIGAGVGDSIPPARSS